MQNKLATKQVYTVRQDQAVFIGDEIHFLAGGFALKKSKNHRFVDLILRWNIRSRTCTPNLNTLRDTLDTFNTLDDDFNDVNVFKLISSLVLGFVVSQMPKILYSTNWQGACLEADGGT